MNKRMTKLLSSGKVKGKGAKKHGRDKPKTERGGRKGSSERAPAGQRHSKRQMHLAPSSPGNRDASRETEEGGGAPGPDADESVLRAWHKDHIGLRFAKLPYLRVLTTCHWCLAEDEPLPFALPGERGGVRKYCKEECAKAAAAYNNLYRVEKGAKSGTEKEGDTTEDAASEQGGSEAGERGGEYQPEADESDEQDSEG